MRLVVGLVAVLLFGSALAADAGSEGWCHTTSVLESTDGTVWGWVSNEPTTDLTVPHEGPGCGPAPSTAARSVVSPVPSARLFVDGWWLAD